MEPERKPDPSTPPAQASDDATDSSSPADCRAELIERVFRQHNQSLVRFLACRLASDQEAREVAQEAYVRLLQLDRPGAVGFLRAFLFKTAANLATDRLRHRQVVRAVWQREWFDLEVGAAPESQVAAQQDVAVIESALAELPPRCREAFLLSRIGGLGTSEIADRMRIGKRMVRLYLARAVLHCRDRLDQAHAPGRNDT